MTASNNTARGRTADRPRVVIAMIEAGGGHKSVSKAVAEALEDLYPGRCDIEIPDFALEVGAHDFDAKHKAQWNFLLDKAIITKIAYRVQDFFGPLTRFFVLRWAKEFVEKAESWFMQNDPEVFVSTHWLNAAVACVIKKRHPQLRFKHVYYLTEPLDASSLQIWKGADRYLVGSERVAAIYRRRGIPSEKTAVIGFPVSPSFFHPGMNKAQVIAKYGLDEALPTIVMSAGAEGLGSLAAMARRVIDDGLPINLVVVCGRNANLKSDLENLLARRQARLSTETKGEAHGTGTRLFPRCAVTGFTPDMANLTAAADLVAIKSSPGGSFEAIFSRKPVVFIEGVAAYEGIIARLAAERGVGWVAKKPEQFVALVKDLLLHPEKLAACSKAAAGFGMENGAYPMAREIGAILSLET